ncbi:HAD superfamily phosphatase (TIGR01668 family) [Natronobacillus azotifigens]|uniref:YqeG family HAD IIIA-type phosphatase n=1 Tax=Natronobacillus azotifigens TaxID=472978 RepID=A0A9J6RAD6_9BACI|nr:YqeG family HAD IIIA-type phosphatase [Natronobacillus azotifigens]MCZ0702326.1 YqeG family HAD IIIA-type phosphatase [Natronobacillus azotifigens]
MLKKFLPNQHVKSISEISPSDLKKQGMKGIITDLDNTLVAWNEPDATPDIIDWFKIMEENDIKVTIISNNKESRVRIFSEPLKAPFVHSARKPLKRAFIRAAKEMGLKREEIVVIGDQVLTDVFGGNRAGFHTILVVPIIKTDDKITKFNRKMERRILDKMKKKGWVTWEE